MCQKWLTFTKFLFQQGKYTSKTRRQAALDLAEARIEELFLHKIWVFKSEYGVTHSCWDLNPTGKLYNRDIRSPLYCVCSITCSMPRRHLTIASIFGQNGQHFHLAYLKVWSYCLNEQPQITLWHSSIGCPLSVGLYQGHASTQRAGEWNEKGHVETWMWFYLDLHRHFRFGSINY